MTAHAACPDDPIEYDEFRSGLTFSDIVAELRQEAEQRLIATGERYIFGRRSVLGRWHQRKREAYADYLRWIGAA